MNLQEHIRAERADFMALLESLSAEDFAAPSLCAEWSVRDVAAHAISYDCVGATSYAAAFVASGLSIDRTNQRLVAQWRRKTSDDIVAAFRKSPTPRHMMKLLGRRIGLIDAFVHQQDIRRPLSRPRHIPKERVVTLIELLRRHRIGAGGATRAKGLRLEAEDLEWASGSGPVVRGPGEAIVMVLAGRSSALSDLSGEGKSLLSERLGMA